MLSSRCRAILCAKLRALASAPPVPQPIPPSTIQPPPVPNARRLYGASFGIGPASIGDLVGSGIVNRQASGDWLVIWDLQVFAAGSFAAVGAVFDLCIIQGTQSQNSNYQVEPSFPANSFAPTIPSSAWGFKDAAANEASKPFYSLSLPVGGYQWVHDWPLCAIAPGQSVVAYSDTNAYNSCGAAFMFEVVPGGI